MKLVDEWLWMKWRELEGLPAYLHSLFVSLIQQTLILLLFWFHSTPWNQIKKKRWPPAAPQKQTNSISSLLLRRNWEFVLCLLRHSFSNSIINFIQHFISFGEMKSVDEMRLNGAALSPPAAVRSFTNQKQTFNLFFLCSFTHLLFIIVNKEI